MDHSQCQARSRAIAKMQVTDRKRRLDAGKSDPQEMTDDDEFDYLLWLARFNKFLLDSRIGYPYYSPAYVREHIDKPTTNREKLHQYKTTAEPTRLTTAKRYVYFLLSLAFLIKSLGLPLLIFSEFDLKNPESNVIMLTNDTYRFGCLISNCTKLGQSARDQHNGTINLEQLSETLFELPYLSLCYPLLSNLYDPIQNFAPIASMLAAILGVMFTLGSPLSLLRCYYKADNMMLMFLAAPRVTRQVVKERAKRLLRELTSSRTNYKRLDARLSDINREQSITNQYPTGSFREVLRNAREASPLLHMPTKRSTRSGNQVSLGICAGHTSGSPGLLFSGYRAYSPESCNSIQFVRVDKNKLRQQLATLQELEEEELQKLAPFDGASQFAAQDCLSVMRSAWWRARALDRILPMTVALISFCVLVYALSLFTVFKLVPDRQVRCNEIGSKSENCSIWRIDRQINNPLLTLAKLEEFSSQSETELAGRRHQLKSTEQYELREQVHLDRLQLESSSIRTLLYIAQFLLTLVGHITFMLIFFMTVEEITGWLCEVKFELLLGTEFVKQLVASSCGQSDALRPLPNQDQGSGARKNLSQMGNKCHSAQKRSQQYQQFKMNETIRSKFKPLAGLSFIINDCKLMGNDCLPTSSYLESVQAIEEYVTERIVADRLCLCSAVDLLEKLYTSFRIHVEHVRCYDRTMTIMIVSANMYNYFVIFTSIFYIRSVEGFLWFPTFILLFSWSYVNTVIVIASNFHAKANKLHSLIWTLLAVTSECSDIRIRHMRHLWLKQMLALDSDGGLSLKALGLRITYTNIIQLVVISGTIVVFMLR